MKTPQEKFPEAAIRGAGYGRGVAWTEKLERRGNPRRNSEPAEIRRALPGDPDDVHSRYIEARVGGVVIGCLYLPNGNPAPGPKFDYKLPLARSPDRTRCGIACFRCTRVLAGDFNVIPTKLTCTSPNAGWRMRCFEWRSERRSPG